MNAATNSVTPNVTPLTPNAGGGPSPNAAPADGDGKVKLCIRGCGNPQMPHANFCSQACLDAASEALKTQDAQQQQQKQPAKVTRTEENELEAKKYGQLIRADREKKKGCFLVEEREDGNEYSQLAGNRRTPINSEKDNHAMTDLLLEVCDLSRSQPIARLVIDRLGYEARKAASKLRLRKFSAMSSDGKRLYWPLADPKQLLRVTAEAREIVANGTNDDHLWLEIPIGDALDVEGDGVGLLYTEGDPKDGLAEFERLIVGNQACAVPEMQWFVAMQEALYPGVRDLNSVRMLVRHSGAQTSGKTSGAQMIATMHGLQFLLNVSEAYLRRTIRDCGLAVIDNLEEEDQTRNMQRHQIASATGGRAGRCGAASDKYRPVEVYCSITGSSKPEIESRYVVVEYHLEDDQPLLNMDAVLREIRQKRHVMLSALMQVYQRFLKINQAQRPIAVPREIRAPGNFTAIALLLHAYADVAQKPSGWADAIIEVWGKTVAAEKAEIEGDEYTALIEMFVNEVNNVDGKDVDHVDGLLYECFKNSRDETRKDRRPSSPTNGQMVRCSVTRVTPAKLLAFLTKTQSSNMRRLNLNSANQLGARITEKMKTPRFWIERRKVGSERFIEIVEPASKPVVASQAVRAVNTAKLNAWRCKQTMGSEHTVQVMSAATGVLVSTCGVRVENWNAEGKANLLSGFTEGKPLTGATRFQITEPQPVVSRPAHPTVRPVYGTT